MDNNQVPTEQEGPDELQILLDFFRQHGNILAYGVSLILILLIVFMGYRNYRASQSHQSWEKLWSAKSAQDFEIVLEDYPSSPAAPVALLKAAKAYFDAQKYSLSIKKYDAFLTKCPQHRFAHIATMGKFHCQEALGRVNEALKGFTAFAAQNPDHYLTPKATLGRARCLGHMERNDEARAAYEEIISARPDSGWSMRAKESLKLLGRRVPPAISVTLPIPPDNATNAPVSATGVVSNPAPLIDLSNFNMPK